MMPPKHTPTSPASIEKNNRVLIVDDHPSIHDDFRKVLGKPHGDTEILNDDEALLFDLEAKQERPYFEIDSAYQGEDGVELVRQSVLENRPFALALVDVRMPPGIDGIETIRRIWEIDPSVQVVSCTAYSDYTIDDIIELFGHTDQLLTLKKPYDVGEATLMVIALVEKWNLTREWVATVERKSEELDDTTRLLHIVNSCQKELQTAHNDLKAEAYQQRNRLDQQSTEMTGTRDITILALAQLAESRDPKIGNHIERIRAYSQILAEHLSNHGPYQHLIDDQFLEDFYRSTPLHDIGKIGIPDEILLKPGPLTSDQFEIMQQHVLLGVEALEKTIEQSEFAGFLQMAVDIAKHHHERYDGNGYPTGLSGQDIPLPARIVALADVFDALTSNRVYKEAMDLDEARAFIEADEGKQFDPVVLSAFRERFDDLVRVRTTFDEGGIDWNASFGFSAPTNAQSVCANDPHEN